MIKQQLSYAFRHLESDSKEESFQEAIANCRVAFERLARQVKAGRKVGSKLNICDPYSRYAQLNKGIRIMPIDHHSLKVQSWIQIAVEDNHTPIPEQVALRIDVPEWMSGMANRTRKIASDLAKSCSTSEVARNYDITQGRIGQLRRELHDSWLQFQGIEALSAAI